MAAVGEVIDSDLFASPERHDVIRIGERAPIPRHIRSAVWYRDHGHCELCADGTTKCRVVNGYRRSIELGDEMPTWHERRPIEEATTVAFCVHCFQPGLTDQPL